MAATDLSNEAGDYLTKRISMEATAGNARQVILPGWCTKVTAYFVTSVGADEAGKVASSGTDGSAIGNDYFPAPSGQGLEFTITRQVESDSESVYLAGSSNSGFCHIVLEAE